jgi:hypothetical protein
MKGEPVPVVKAIEYLASCGWTLKARGVGFYLFHNPKHVSLQYLTFTLSELRDAYRRGF